MIADCGKCVHRYVCGKQDDVREEPGYDCEDMRAGNIKDLISRSKLRDKVGKLPNANPSYSHTCDVVERKDVFDLIDNAD